MTAAQDSVDLVRGRDLLARLPELYSAVARSAELQTTRDGWYGCSIELPTLGRRTCTAQTARGAIHAVFEVMVDECTKAWPDDRWAADILLFTSKHGSARPAFVIETKKPVERFQAKPRQFTIGVTMPTKLKEALQGAAQDSGESFAELTRQLTRVGFEEFDTRAFSENTPELISELLSEVRRWLPSASEQVMVRLETDESVRLRAAAKEFRRSASELGAMCLATGFAKRTQFVAIQRKVEEVLGPPTRVLARQVGLGKRPALLSSVLAGSIRAPKKVLRSLAENFVAPPAVLSDYFQRTHAARGVPAFKKLDGKPEVVEEQIAWADAVKSLNLPASEADELLALDD